MTTTPVHACGHERAVWRVAHRALSAHRPPSLACMLASKMYCDELMARCQSQCGPYSPFLDVTLRPFSRHQAVECLRRHGTGLEAATMVRFAHHSLRSLLGTVNL